MLPAKKAFLISLIDDNNVSKSTLPNILLSLTDEEYNSILIGEARTRISNEFNLKSHFTNYGLFAKQNGVFTMLKMLDLFSVHAKDHTEFYLSRFSSKELNEKEEQTRIKEQEEEKIALNQKNE